MNILIKMDDITQENTELIVVSLFENENELPRFTMEIDTLLHHKIQQLIVTGDIKGKFAKIHLLYPDNLLVKRVMIVGMGKKKELTLDKIRHLSATISSKILEMGLTKYTTILHGYTTLDVPSSFLAEAIGEGSLLGTYRYTTHKTKKDEQQIDEMTLIIAEDIHQVKVESGIKKAIAIYDGVKLARELSNGPGNLMTPDVLVDTAKKLAKTYSFKSTIFAEKELKKQGMGCLLAVAKGSDKPPYLIILEYHCQNKEMAESVAVVGKGITFDSGGINIKPTPGMFDMKFDMGGAAAVLGLAKVVGELRPQNVNLLFVVPTCENLLGERAYRPGDILTAYNGKTIEIQSTDAEGRLILADALSYTAQNYQPTVMFDIATLTGACLMALGRAACGVMSLHPELVEKVKQASETSGERAWQLPLYEEHKNVLESTYADLRNKGGREGSALIAGWFLQHFTENIPWLHFDIAGMAISTKNKGYYRKGATGFGVRLLTHLILNW